ncbi:MAG TPA: four-carbon acid sugar kinase family protein [Rubrobacteraceae bacterium]|nr:four-carbon acid sugar kinase family protein [Rubrobacteraceae bacterium]
MDGEAYLASQPPELRVEGALGEIRRRVEESERRVAVLDDDPTGVQSVHGVPVLTTWGVSDLRWALSQHSPTFYVLTNSRSLPREEATALNREIADNLAQAAGPSVDFEVVSRSDSTLRGHYPAETDALAQALGERGRAPDALVICPAFFEAGRITVDDLHWVRRDGELVPAGQTEFADDHSFGYGASDLKSWVEEKTGGRIRAEEVLSVGLADLRQGGPTRVTEILDEASGGRPLVLNCASYADLEVFVLGLLAAEEKGKRFLYRTGPSFVRTRGGITEPRILGAGDLYRERPGEGHGLVLVGSYVPTTTRQLEAALALGGITAIEIPVPRLLDPGRREEELQRVAQEVNTALASSEVLVYTSRELVTAGEVGLSNFEIGASVSGALVEVMRRVDRALPLSFVVAKGGITSSDIATRGLGVRRAEVAGPLLPPGIVPVWILPEENDFPGLPYVIFPGNVGGPESLAHAIEVLRGER